MYMWTVQTLNRRNEAIFGFLKQKKNTERKFNY